MHTVELVLLRRGASPRSSAIQESQVLRLTHNTKPHMVKTTWSLKPNLETFQSGLFGPCQAWVGPLGLAALVQGSGICRVLTCAADEGSQGFSLFCFLAARGFRINFQRDPCHKLSGVFINTLQTTPRIMAIVLDILLVFKWRRAPFGSGRFWRQSVQTLQLLMQQTGVHHPLMDMFRESIARDFGVAVESLDTDDVALRGLLEEVCQVPTGISARAWSPIHMSSNVCLCQRMFLQLTLDRSSDSPIAVVSGRGYFAL